MASAFQFGLSDTSNIRLRPDLEPYGAIGDTGWYTMRAAVEYGSPTAKLVSPVPAKVLPPGSSGLVL